MIEWANQRGNADVATSEPMTAEAPPAAAALPPLAGRLKAAFSLGDLPDSVAVNAANTFLLFYLTAVCGLPGALAGAALAIAQVFDAFSDPLIGFFTDNARSRIGRRHPFILAAVWPLALSLGLLFSIPHMAPGLPLFAYATAVLLVMRVSHSAFTLPYAALGAELVTDYAERSVMTTYRWSFNIAGAAICIALGLAVFMRGKEGLLDQAAYVGFGWSCAFVALAGGLVSGVSTLRLRHRLRPAPTRAEAPRLSSLPSEIADVFRNPSFRVLFVTALVFFSTQGMAVALGLHANRYFWKLPTPVIQNVLFANLAGLAIGLPLAGLILRRVQKHHAAAVGIGAIALCQLTPPVLRLTGVMTLEGPPLWYALGAFSMLAGCAMTCVVIPFWSMMADAADEHLFRFGSQREALYFAGLTLSAKAATGIGGLVAGLSLDAIAFPHDPAVLARGAVAADTVVKLGWIYGPGGALGIGLAAFILTRYALDRAACEHIQATLAARATT